MAAKQYEPEVVLNHHN
ncbi:hypothetical protein LINPERPRIM_LOCUS38849 [Linum perenne]